MLLQHTPLDQNKEKETNRLYTHWQEEQNLKACLKRKTYQVKIKNFAEEEGQDQKNQLKVDAKLWERNYDRMYRDTSNQTNREKN